MRIVVLHNRYHVTGGPERYLFGLEERLHASGHTLIPFCVRYAQNRPSPYAHYFVAPPGVANAVYFRDVRGLPAKIRLFGRSIYSAESRRRLAHLIENERPDVAYVLIVANFLSPSTILACRDANLPIVMRLSDFHLIVPCYHFFDGKEVCELCLHGSRLHAVRKKCLQDSRLVSLARVISMAVHDRLRIYDSVDYFVSPSTFLRDRMIESGLTPERIVHIPTFVETEQSPSPTAPGDDLLYVGRLSREKGVFRLLEAFRRAGSPGRLLIVGDTSTAEGIRVQREITGGTVRNVYLLGPRSSAEVTELMQAARAIVVPSICYENVPRVALEAMRAGRPVIAHNLGSLPEAVVHQETGFLCDPDDPDDMASRIRDLWLDRSLAQKLGDAGRHRVEHEFGSEMHVQRLLQLWERARSKTARP